MVKVVLAGSLPRATDALVVGLTEGSDGPEAVGLPPSWAKREVRRELSQAIESVGAQATVGQVKIVPFASTRIVLAGLGAGRPTSERLRQAAGAALRALRGLDRQPVRQVVLSLGWDRPDDLKAIAEGALLGFHRYAGQPGAQALPQTAPALEKITLLAEGNPLNQRSLELAQAVAEAVCATRDWVNQPPNQLYPAALAEIAQTVADRRRLNCRVLEPAALAEQGYGGLMAVGGGSQRGPRLVQLTWRPRGAKSHVALIGKGITFDSGGINLKPRESMATMRCDMAGAAACLATIAAVADLDLKVKVTAWLPLAENLPSGSAYRPSDVIQLYGGATVENYNTDAEGRLVLADALRRAAQDKPDLMVDIATLTGACIVALGNSTIGLMASDDVVADQVLDAAEAAGEPIWHLPITEEAERALRSTVADLKSGGPREGGALVAAAFLRRFTESIPWAHLDIAGPAFNEGEARGHIPAGGTGAGVRSLIALLTSLAAA
ncbi:MAG: leucyl aminopeptidase [Propionibacteriaceae bacterium]|jgi:leucyl aminopeptidase|nr:leucyl aminopeptidase [Propionibacteriaceae bacterium]